MLAASVNVLVSLHRGYGLGDTVQVSAVLRHVVKYRPHWTIDFQAEPCRHNVGRGIVNNTFAFGDLYTSPHYDAEVEILLFDTFANWHDRPNTHVSSCLHDRFGMKWDHECGRYQVNVSCKSVDAASALLRHSNCVAVHYEGVTCPEKKNLTHEQANEICLAIKRLGREPVILDWYDKSPLPFRRITTPQRWGTDPEMVCAVISQCEAFVGIDSGPSKCASATETPTLVVWTGHHPALYHDPSPNTTHLVPIGYHKLSPVRGSPNVVDFFERNYNIREYDNNPTKAIKLWLMEMLK